MWQTQTRKFSVSNLVPQRESSYGNLPHQSDLPGTSNVIIPMGDLKRVYKSHDNFLNFWQMQAITSCWFVTNSVSMVRTPQTILPVQIAQLHHSQALSIQLGILFILHIDDNLSVTTSFFLKMFSFPWNYLYCFPRYIFLTAQGFRLELFFLSLHHFTPYY